jgi:hypothetical protein
MSTPLLHINDLFIYRKTVKSINILILICKGKYCSHTVCNVLFYYRVCAGVHANMCLLTREHHLLALPLVCTHTQTFQVLIFEL